MNSPHLLKENKFGIALKANLNYISYVRDTS